MAKEDSGKLYTRGEVDELVRAAIAEALKTKPQVVQVENKVPKVSMRFFAAINKDNRIDFGSGGKYGSFYTDNFDISVDKSAFVGDFRTPTVRKLLADRFLIVLDGLTDDERAQYGVNYKEGEIIDYREFDALLDNEAELAKRFGKLCQTHKEMVAVRLCERYEAGKLKISRAVIEKLNARSQRDYARYAKDDIHRKGAFYPIIKAMNEQSEATGSESEE